MLRIKSFLLAAVALSAFLTTASAETLTGTLKDSTGASYTATISPVVTTPPPVTEPPPAVEPPPVVVEPPPIATGAPATWNDARFNGSASSGTLQIPSGGTLLSKTITTHAEPASIVMGSNSTLRKVRVGGLSRESVRIGSGTYTVEDSWLEAKGTGDDHADVIQAYAGSGGGGPLNLTLRNSTVRAYNDAATAGLFVADKVYGKVTLDNVMFQGGPFGLALYSDVNTIDVYANHVCFVGPFGWRPIDFRNAGGSVVVKQWDDVRNCTIVNGALVKGALIPRP